MSWRSVTERARAIVFRTLETDEPEVERMLVAGALVTRRGDHYRVEKGSESADELERLARHVAGRCDCGGLLSSSGSRLLCRSCGREFRH